METNKTVLTEEERKNLLNVFLGKSLNETTSTDSIVDLEPLFEAFEDLLAKKMEEKEEEFREDLKYLKRSYQESNIDENFIESALNELTVKYKLN